jgi:hypothetical protein
MTAEKPAKNGHSNTYTQLSSLPASARLSSNPPAARHPEPTTSSVACSRRALRLSHRAQDARVLGARITGPGAVVRPSAEARQIIASSA